MEASRQTRYTTLDLVVMAVIGVVFAILNNVAGVFFQTFTATTGPVLAQIFAIFGIAPCLAMFIIRKPGAAIITFILNSAVQALAGNPAGLGTLGWGVLEGGGTELVFLATRYRSFGPVVMFVSAGVGAIFSSLWTYTLFGLWGTLVSSPLVFVGTNVLGFFTFGVESGLVAYGIGLVLQRSGLLNSFKGGELAEARRAV
jgi:energy-coupling factor transport system substrate-specific component